MESKYLANYLGRYVSGGLVSAGAGRLQADYYVSNVASNGYAEGDNANAGTSREAPWATLAYAITNAPAGSVIGMNEGTYTAASVYTLNKSLSIVAERRRQTILKCAASQVALILVQGAAAGSDILLRGLVLDCESSTNRCCRPANANAGGAITLRFQDCEFKNPTQAGIFGNSANERLHLFVTSCDITNSATTVTHGIQQSNLLEGSVTVNGLTGNVSTAATTFEVVRVTAGATGIPVQVSGVNVDVDGTGATNVRGVVIANAAGVIESNDINLNGGTTGTLYQQFCSSASFPFTGGIIRNNTGSNMANGGYCVLYGTDTAGVGDDGHNGAVIYGNTLSANPDATTPIHGLMLGNGTGGEVYTNTITGAGLALIAKQQTGGEFYENTINECNSQALRAKGATDTVFRDNVVNLSASYAGDCVTVDANDSPATDSTGIELTDNVFNIDAAPAKIVDVATGSDAAFTGNTYNVNTTLGADSWEYQGTAYQTLEAWKAAVEPTAHP